MKLNKIGVLSIGCLSMLNAANFIEVQGTASGTFSGGGTSITSGSSTLTYLPSSFTGFLSEVAPGSNVYALSIGAAAGTPNVNNLGSFEVTPDGLAGSSFSDTFTLSLNFSLPTLVAGTLPATYNADVTGTVYTTNAGFLQVDFPSTINLPNYQNAYTFRGSLCSSPTAGCTGPLVQGNLGVSINDLQVIPGNPAIALSGGLRAAATGVPEPASMVLMGAGLVLVGAVRRFGRE